MSIEPEDLLEGFDLPLLLELDLAMHQRELFVYLMVVQVSTDPHELAASLFDLAVSNELTRRVGHERR
jgi:hypothetical protein